MRILLADDEESLTRLIARGLQGYGYTVEVARTGEEAFDKAKHGDYDVIVLDVMFTDVDGVTICRRLRRDGALTPILLLTARDAVSDKVHGLDAGADDYMTKPFALEELVARLRALARRVSAGYTGNVLRVGDLSLNPETREVTRGGHRIELTPKEFALLELLMRHPGRVLTRDIISERVWGYPYDPANTSIDTYVHFLRRKVDRHGTPLIHSVRGIGYKIQE